MTPRSFLVSRQNKHLKPSHQSVSSPLAPAASQKTKDDRESNNLAGSSITSVTTAKMAVNQRQIAKPHSSPGPSPPKSTTTLTRPTTPTSPVQIPTKANNNKSRESAHPLAHRNRRNREVRRERSSSPRWTEIHSPDAIPPSVAALLAVTSIPRPRSQRGLRQLSTMEKRMTVESIIEQTQETEKELSRNFIRGPLDLLLSPPEDLDGDDDMSIGESTMASPFSTRAVSLESLPSLTDSFVTDPMQSVETPRRSVRGRKSRPTKRSLTPVSSPPGEREEHPLSLPSADVEELDFRVFESPPESVATADMIVPFRPFKSAFKSNLTASLRALRNAARSFSSMNLPSIPADDFLTRSILTLDPQVPFTDERMPPTLDEEPTAALRRYLNPTQTVRLESQTTQSSTEPAQSTFTASIQMQTYKVQRSRSAPPTGSSRIQISMSPRSSRGNSQSRGKEAALSFPTGSGPRQREMRENSDFIRVAVMEMAMRKSGKLDDQRPGRARWALPPRKLSSKPYEVGSNGVPARWVSVTY